MYAQQPSCWLSVVISLAAGLVATVAYSHAQEPEKAQTYPNIVLIVADDLGINDLHCYGRRDHHTPNLDRLAGQGIRYTSAYCGLSICSASRASLMTGKFPSRLQMTTYLPGRADADSQLLLQPRVQSYLPLEEQTIAELLKNVGYRAGIFGKWHLGGNQYGPKNQGFDMAVEPSGNGKLDEETGGKNEYAIARAASQFLLDNQDKPTFCYVPHHSPHIGLAAPPSLVEKNGDAFHPLYAATVESLDNSIGLLLATIDKLERPTVVIFTSDNGGLHVPEGHPEPVTHNGPFRAGKGYLYEGGLRVPLIVRWSNQIAAGQTIDAPVSLIDLTPTLMDLAGIDPAKSTGPLDGVSLKSHWLAGGTQGLSAERRFYWHFPHYTNQGSRPAAAMRQGKWKLIEYLEDHSHELYDLESDIGEKEDIATRYPDQTLTMAESLHQWQLSSGAQMCSENTTANRELHRALYVDNDPTRLDASSASAKAVGEQWRDWRKKMNEVVVNRQAPLKSAVGEIHLPASQGTVHGKNLRYEPESYKNVLGYWTEVDDWADWEIKVPNDGRYEVEVQYGCGVKGGGSVVAIEAESQSLPWTVKDTGHFQKMITENIGVLDLKAGTARIAARPKSKKGVAVLDIRRIVLRPIAN